MFAKEAEKKLRSTQQETANSLESHYGVTTYLGRMMNPEVRGFFEELADQIGEEKAEELLSDGDEYTEFDGTGDLIAFDCSYAPITFLPELPKGLKGLICQSTKITSLPELPEGLRKLNCSSTQITSLPKLPKELNKLYCSHTQITSLPELPEGLQELHCESTQITSLPELPKGLKFIKSEDYMRTSSFGCFFFSSFKNA